MPIQLRERENATTALPVMLQIELEGAEEPRIHTSPATPHIVDKIYPEEGGSITAGTLFPSIARPKSLFVVPGRKEGKGVKAFMTAEVRRMLDVLEAIISTKAFQIGIPVKELGISVFRDPEEDWTELVFEVKVSALPAQALAFWDSIGREIDNWRTRLLPRLSELLDDRLAVHVVWE